jgi:ankyrin repeat protein
VFHAQIGWTPLHHAAANSSSVAVVQALLAAYPEAAMATDNVRRPSPLAAWMRGPDRSSEVIICNQGQSGVIIRNQRALSGTQGTISGLSVALSGPQRALRGPQR